MKTGIELIAKERQEQIEKHGFDIKNDQDYPNNELIKAALFCIDSNVFEWPQFWGTQFRWKIEKNDRITRLTKAGSFIAAEIDRLINSSTPTEAPLETCDCKLRGEPYSYDCPNASEVHNDKIVCTKG